MALLHEIMCLELISPLSRRRGGIQQAFVLCPASPTKIKLFSPNYGLQRHPKPFRLKCFRISRESSANTTWRGTTTTASALKQFNSWRLSKELVFPDSISHRSPWNFFPPPSLRLARDRPTRAAFAFYSLTRDEEKSRL